MNSGISGRGRTRSRSASTDSSRSYTSSLATKHAPERISSHSELLPIRYSGETNTETDRHVRIVPFKRKVYSVSHGASPADFAQYEWIIKHGATDKWYEQPSLAVQKQMVVMDEAGCLPDDFLCALEQPVPLSLPVPKVWASAALVTPTDDDIYDCIAGHSVDPEFAGACHRCTDERAEALEKCSLIYFVVMSTFQAFDNIYRGTTSATGTGKTIYKVVKCGRREAAASEAFYAAGINGWNVVFSCVRREGDRGKKVTRVDELWKMAEKPRDGQELRVFY
ncbi:hypothetical protein AOQ84DRAFT_280301 [Glonium stellatum]|uniref:Uncharacterized protein n=1 Tax=Glonium stellatum TaxID=574774 RepID=A0A8E2JZ42_9PEZI|nr:hypothetical protein AOQ84DRAFT_280301 [Glonium stellatum]